jgi:plasminogen activator inhibitor 1 RNA-binding protein
MNTFSLLDLDESPPVKPSTNVGSNNNNNNKKTVRNHNEQHAHHGAAQRSGAQGQQNGGGRPPKREHDRKSGTGRDGDVKRQGKGAHNWGSAANDNRELAATRNWDAAPTQSGADASWEEAAPEETAEEVVDTTPAVPVEPEIEQLDLSEYLKSQEALRVEEDSQLEIRRVAQDDQEQIFVPSDDEDETGLLSLFNEKKKKSKKAGKKNAVSLDEFTKDAAKKTRGGSYGGENSRGRGQARGGGSQRGAPRGGRGGGASRGGRGGGFQGRQNSRGGASAGPRVNIDDKSAFPSLSSPISAK